MNAAACGVISDSCDKNNRAGVVVINMQIQSALWHQSNACYLGFNSPSDIITSLHIPKMSEGGVSATFDSPRFPHGQSWHPVRGDTLNLGTGRSVSLYLVQRRPILGSRTISTGAIPGFCRRGGGHTTLVIHPIHNFTRPELVAK